MGSRAEGGSTALEMVGLIPIVLVLIMALLQAGFSLYGISATQTAARQAARAASLGDSPEAAADTALPGWLDPTVAMVGPGNGVRVSVNLPDVVPGTDLIVDREAILP
ncbi:MAG: TadE/TadG family type IV pilus assembly protein [Nocardioidaceae bacterium]